MEKISVIRERLDYLHDIEYRGSKLNFILGGISLASVASCATSLSLYTTPIVDQVNLPCITAGTLTSAIVSLLGAYFVSRKLRDTEEEIIYLEDKYYPELMSEQFMERISSYTR